MITSNSARLVHHVRLPATVLSDLPGTGKTTLLNRVHAQPAPCLLPVNAFTPEMWFGLRDPFPAWGEQALEMAE